MAPPLSAEAARLFGGNGPTFLLAPPPTPALFAGAAPRGAARSPRTALRRRLPH
jgi:hypothetical protein